MLELILAAIGYCFVAGLTVGVSRRTLMKQDNNCNGRFIYNTKAHASCTVQYGHWQTAAIIGALWPVSWVVFAGIYFGSRTQISATRREDRRKEELATMRHERALLTESRATMAVKVSIEADDTAARIQQAQDLMEELKMLGQ